MGSATNPDGVQEFCCWPDPHSLTSSLKESRGGSTHDRRRAAPRRAGAARSVIETPTRPIPFPLLPPREALNSAVSSLALFGLTSEHPADCILRVLDSLLLGLPLAFLRVSESGCRCLACGASWGPDRFHWLARLLGCPALPA
jgi:hypothetical protein